MTWSEELASSENRHIQQMLRNTGKMPRHVAIIMDGNGRWAQERGRLRIDGHKEGMESVRAAVKTSSQLGIKYLTLYAFSIENWKRPVPEVRFLMSLLESYLRKEVDELHDNGVRIKTIGKTNALPKAVQRVLQEAISRTSMNEGLTLTLALSYGSRWDILRAMQVLAMDIRRGTLSPEDLTEEMVSSSLQTSFMPDPDLIIRTSGEVRLSNFLLWEAAYSELYITEGLWPDFRSAELYRALTDYVMRERRFGKISAQVRSDSSATTTSTLERILNALK